VPYENTMTCWNFLEMASKFARYLDFVPAAAFVDRRNPDPRLYADPYRANPDIYVSGTLEYWDFDLPGFPALPTYELFGFRAEQRYLLEIWVEKSTMNDVLIPLCEKYNVNLVTGVGEQSITSTLDLINRIVEHGKPTRIFYVSDFDPAGRSMPVAVARKAEYYLKKMNVNADVRLFPVALTQEQCEDFALPRTPIKESERRKEKFEERFGTGATELDALEALYPGALRSLLEEHILCYYDETLRNRVSEAAHGVERELEGIREYVFDKYRDEYQAIKSAYDELREEFEARVELIKESTGHLWERIKTDLEENKPNVDNFALPEAVEADEVGDGLLNSQWNYLQQLSAYKHFQGKPNGFGEMSEVLEC